MPSDFSHFAGHSKLIQKIIEEISLKGPLTFARFMELALYDEQYGYYMTQATAESEASTDRIGMAGDFVTAPELSPILAKSLVCQVIELDEHLHHPPGFTVLEMGAGNGTFARDFLQQCLVVSPGLFDRLSYRIVERSPHLQTSQNVTIGAILKDRMEEHVTWAPSLEHIHEASVIGVIFSNELVDALPVHRVRWQDQSLQEIFVTYQDGQFFEQTGPVSAPELSDYVCRYGLTLSEGQTTELPLQADALMTQVARVLKCGAVITIDYGHTASDYYHPDRKNGTLLCYYRQKVSENPYVRIGEQDMTAHVNFSALAQTGKECALQPIGFTSLANWLMGLGVEEFVQDEDPESKEVQALTQLLRPHGMGTTFKVLVQGKGIESVPLQGLRYRAFFDDVL